MRRIVRLSAALTMSAIMLAACERPPEELSAAEPDLGFEPIEEAISTGLVAEEERALGAVGPRGITHRLAGQASWYGKDFHGRPTACGELFDMNEFTAAHRTLPLGAQVRVIDRETGKQVEVRVTDRGPGVPGRVIDLSWAASKALDLEDRGTIPVEVEVLDWGDPENCRS